MNLSERGHQGWRGAGDSHLWLSALSPPGMLFLSSWSLRALHQVSGPTSGQQKGKEGEGKVMPLPFKHTPLLLIQKWPNLVAWSHLIMREAGKCRLYSGCLWAQLKLGWSDTTRIRKWWQSQSAVSALPEARKNRNCWSARMGEKGREMARRGS